MSTETNTTDSLMRDIEKLKQQRDNLRKLVAFHEAEATRLRKEIQCLKDDAADAEARGVSLQRAHGKAGGKQKELRGLATSFPGVMGQVQFTRPKASTTKVRVSGYRLPSCHPYSDWDSLDLYIDSRAGV
jgi:chromosome segregation ATPase